MTLRAALLLSILGCAIAAAAQAAAPASTPPSALEVTLAYSADRTNGVVGGSFWMQGARAEANAQFARHVSVVAELAGEHAGSINSAGESLSLVSYLFGPRYTFTPRSRSVLFGQFLVGGVHGFDALFPQPSGSTVTPDAFAFAAGGGINLRLSRRFALRAIQADYFQTQLPNDGNDRQNHFRISAGLVFRFGQSRR
jgi:Outer membrane protein beta-barrel domain